MTELLETPVPQAAPDPASTNWVPIGPAYAPPSFAPSSSVRVYGAASQSIPNNAWTTLSFAGARYDTDGCWSAANPTRLTCKKAGTYIVSAMIQFPSASGGTTRFSTIVLNGGGATTNWYAIGGQQAVNWVAGGPMANAVTLLNLSVGDYVEVMVIHDAGSSLTMATGNLYGLDFSMSMVGGSPGPAGALGRRATLITSAAVPLINTDSTDFYRITALATNITGVGVSGTGQEGQTLWVAITDNGTPRTITWGSAFEASTVALPTTTVANTRLDVGFAFDWATSKWRCVAVA